MCLISHCVGAIGATFALGACLSARFRDKDDYKNAVIGGILAGSIFGYKSKCPKTHVHFAMYIHLILCQPW